MRSRGRWYERCAPRWSSSAPGGFPASPRPPARSRICAPISIAMGPSRRSRRPTSGSRPARAPRRSCFRISTTTRAGARAPGSSDSATTSSPPAMTRRTTSSTAVPISPTWRRCTCVAGAPRRPARARVSRCTPRRRDGPGSSPCAAAGGRPSARPARSGCRSCGAAPG